MKKEETIKNLESKGYVHVEYPRELRQAVEEGITAWKTFCSLPEELRSSFLYNKGKGMGVGFELKKTPGTSLDLKEDFHYTTGQREWLSEAAQKVGDQSASELVAKANTLVNLMAPFVMEFAQRIEREFSISGFAQEVADSQDQWFLRFLHYFGNKSVGDEIATSHADKCGFTLHLYESEPGLQFLEFDMKWKNIPIFSGETVIIPGMRLQYRSRNRLKALFHRVLATDETAKKGRFSMVCFIHIKRTPQYDKANAGRLQEFEPGFNYEMSFDEFSQLFTVP